MCFGITDRDLPKMQTTEGARDAGRPLGAELSEDLRSNEAIHTLFYIRPHGTC